MRLWPTLAASEGNRGDILMKRWAWLALLAAGLALNAQAKVWNFDVDAEGWGPLHHVDGVSVDNGELVIDYGPETAPFDPHFGTAADLTINTDAKYLLV